LRIAIIGGSIAGLESAIQLSDRFETHLFEEHEVIGYPLRCAEGWVKIVVEPYTDGRSIDYLIFRRLDSNLRVREQVKVDVSDILVVVDRPKMEQRMAKIASSRGCIIHTGRRATIKELSKTFDLIVDASGHPSQWCREFGGRRRGGVAVQAIVEEDFDHVYIDCIPKLDGYIWIFPKAKGGAKIGIGFYKRKPKAPLKQILLEYLKNLSVEPIGWTAGLLGVGFNRPFVRYYNSTPVCLVGDSAGLVDLFFAEGMTKAVVSARVLAECIIGGRLDDYEKEFFRRMRLHYLMSSFLYHLKNVSQRLMFKLLKLIFLKNKRVNAF